MSTLTLDYPQVVRESPKMTASNRPTVDLQALLLLHCINDLIDEDCDAELEPSSATKFEAMKMLLSIPVRLLGRPEIGAFCGEVHIQWAKGNRQIVVMCFPNRPPLLHHHLRNPHAASEHGVVNASMAEIENWLEWLRS